MQRNRDLMMRLRATWKARGLCTRCGGEKPCALCREKRKQYKSNTAHQFASTGVSSTVAITS